MRNGYEKRFAQGDIVYWCHQEGHKYSVHYGMVDEQFSDAVCIDYLHHRENRFVNGIPIDEFESEYKYKKLPKGWNYDTKLFEITYGDFECLVEQCASIDIKNPKSIKAAYEKGILVKDSTIFYGDIEAEITKEGYRIVKKYPMWKHHISYTSIRPDKVYFTYKEAKDEVDANIAEFYRQAELSDYDWSVEHIDMELVRWQTLNGVSNEEKNKYRNWLLSMDKVEDIEVRIFNGEIQWKYDKNKKWRNIELY